MAEALEGLIERLEGLADGWDCGAICEEAIVARFQEDLDAFAGQEKADVNLRHIRAAVDARNNAAGYKRDAADVRQAAQALRLLGEAEKALEEIADPNFKGPLGISIYSATAMELPRRQQIAQAALDKIRKGMG